MARDFEDIHDLDDLSDTELRDLVREHLAAHRGIDADDVGVTVRDGRVTLDGRVGTEEERRIAERVVTDVLGVEDCENDLLVDAARRAESPEAADDNLVQEDAEEGLLLGDRPVPLNPESEHLADDVDHELYGTTDVQHAIADGTAWIPPEAPTPEGGVGDEGTEDLEDDR
jgi:hypothetical protein